MSSQTSAQRCQQKRINADIKIWIKKRWKNFNSIRIEILGSIKSVQCKFNQFVWISGAEWNIKKHNFVKHSTFYVDNCFSICIMNVNHGKILIEKMLHQNIIKYQSNYELCKINVHI